MNNIGSGPAEVGGQAQRISAADKIAALQAQGGTLTAEVTVTRAKTGAVEHHTLVFTPVQQEEAK